MTTVGHATDKTGAKGQVIRTLIADRRRLREQICGRLLRDIAP
jgi:hypothetical protein